MNANLTEDFVGKVSQIRLSEIAPNPRNPRGVVDKNESFARLVSSVEEKGILVPIVVAESRRASSEAKYELVDGERRYWAAKELGLERVPAHILHDGGSANELRKLMFHLHMTREQWEPIAQCRSLVDIYAPLKEGLTFQDKSKWVKKIAEQMGMPFNTARDRVQVLAWSEKLKQRVFAYDAEQPTQDIYSYVLAIETSIVDPSYRAFTVSYYNHGRDATEVANEIRAALFEKTVQGLDTGLIRSRDKIRAISPLFSSTLEGEKKRTALGIFKRLVETDVQFEDVHAELSSKLPDLMEEKPPKPQRVIALMDALSRILELYNSSYFESAAKTEAARRRVEMEFQASAEVLADSVNDILKRLK